MIIGLQKTSFIDYPGTISTVLFLSGCNLRCPYCHNSGVVNGVYDEISFDKVKDHILKRKGIIDGVVISGGEPSIHDGLKELCDELRSLGVKIKIDTNGLEPEKIITCAPDYLALDIKTSFDNYSRVNIPPNYYDYRDRLYRSIDFVKSMGENAEIRITAVPGIVDDDDITKLQTELKGVHKIYIQQFEPANLMLDLSYTSVKPYQSYILDNFKKMFVNCDVRGVAGT